MKHWLDFWIDENPKAFRAVLGAIVLIALAACFLALSACADAPLPRGSAQTQAVNATARLEISTAAADKAIVDAASLKAKADVLEQAAKVQPTDERIKAAVDARIAAASASAVAIALQHVADDAQSDAAKLAESARKERDAEAAAADLRSWQTFCRWVGGALVALGALAGGVLGWLIAPMVGARAGVILAGTGIAIITLGATTRWLPLLGVAAVIIVAAEWAWHHRQHKAIP